MGVDRPESARPAIRGQVIAQSVIDIQVEIEAVARHVLELVRLKVLNLDEALECAVTINAGRFRPQGGVKDDGDALDVHGSTSRGE